MLGNAPNEAKQIEKSAKREVLTQTYAFSVDSVKVFGDTSFESGVALNGSHEVCGRDMPEAEQQYGIELHQDRK